MISGGACSEDNSDKLNGENTPIPNIDCAANEPGVSLADDFVCAHNTVRESVPDSQPTPNPALPALVWNQQLADFAQSHADKCVYEHSNDTIRRNAFGQWVGENIAANTGIKYNPFSITDLWAIDEAPNYDYATNTCAPGEKCGHYTQIVWRETTSLGCAKANCPTLINTTFVDAEFWVCEYSPGGNIVGQRPY